MCALTVICIEKNISPCTNYFYHYGGVISPLASRYNLRQSFWFSWHTDVYFLLLEYLKVSMLSHMHTCLKFWNCLVRLFVLTSSQTWRINVFLKLKKVASTPTLWLWRLTLPPGMVVPPVFFMKMTTKDRCKWDYLYALGNFLWRFRATGGKP